MANNVITWADGFGVWHAKVPGEKYSAARDSARLAISDELAERGWLFDGKLTVCAGGPSEGWYEFKEAGE